MNKLLNQLVGSARCTRPGFAGQFHGRTDPFLQLRDDAGAEFHWRAGRPLWRNDGDTVRVRDADGVLRLREPYNE